MCTVEQFYCDKFCEPVFVLFCFVFWASLAVLTVSSWLCGQDCAWWAQEPHRVGEIKPLLALCKPFLPTVLSSSSCGTVLYRCICSCGALFYLSGIKKYKCLENYKYM